MKKLFRFFIGFCVSFGMCIIVWELAVIMLGRMGSFGKSNITRNVIIIFLGIFFSIGYTGFVYYMAHDSIKTIRYKNTVFISLVVCAALFLIRAMFFKYDLSFSYKLVFLHPEFWLLLFLDFYQSPKRILITFLKGS